DTWTTPKGKQQRYVSSRQVVVNGISSTWTISRNTGSQVTVTDPLGQQSVYLENFGTVTNAKIYAGTATGNPLRQYQVDYVSDSDPWKDNCNPNPDDPYVPQPVGNRPIRITTTLEDGRVSKKEFDYETFTYPYHPYHGLSCEQLVTFTTSRGNVTEMREFDYG